MENMDAWGGREGVFVIERSPRDREWTIWVGDQGTRCVRQKDAPREIEIDQVRKRDNAYVYDGD